jgi:glycerophosphoryl diester phosphodiesterase
MTLTRRTLAAGLPLITTAAGWAARAAPAPEKPMGKPLAIAHRGASGERPEHTIMAYKLAIAEGADFIEPDLVMTKDGALVARHENEIGGTTNVSTLSQFASRKTTKTVDGAQVTGWFVEDFTLAEFKTIRARERLGTLRPGSAAYNDQEAIPVYQEIVDLAKSESARLGRTIGTYPEMKHPIFLKSVGLDVGTALLAALRANGLDSKDAPVIVQCFDPEPLRAFRQRCKARLLQLVSPGPQARSLLSPTGLKDVASYADIIGPDKGLIIPESDAGLGPATSVVHDAHALGLLVHPYTVRAENQFLPKPLRVGTAPGDHGRVEEVYAALYGAGIDGLFSDFTALNVAARDKYWASQKA